MGELLNSVVEDVAKAFISKGQLEKVALFGAGNVNDTYLVVADGGEHERFLLQRINQQVFHRPKLIAENLRVFTTHVQGRLAAETRHEGDPRAWETPSIVSTQDGHDYVVDDNGEFWRAITFVENASTHPAILNATHASESGYALGRFHSLVSDLDPALLHDTLEGFHITPQYLSRYDEVYRTLQMGQGNAGGTAVNLTEAEVAFGVNFISRCRHRATLLEDAKAQGVLAQRTIHGDPKVDNILIDDESGKAVSIIDLDTVKPGLVHYDVGDCLRSCCNPLGEDAESLDQVQFELDLCQIILQGYLPIADEFFGAADYDYIYDCVWLIAFELGLRFFTDYLAGDVYFKARYPTHNLQRGLVQFKLAESIEAQEKEIRQIVASFR